MRTFLTTLISTLTLCGNTLSAAQEINSKTESTFNAVPESSVAILFGGLLWFLLLRKRA